MRAAPVGRPAQLTLDAIARTAVEVADAEGLAAVTMRRVAQQLGSGAASLYRHVRTREHLIDEMTERVAAEWALHAATGDWADDLTAMAVEFRLLIRKHRWLADTMPTARGLGPHQRCVLEHTLALLEGHRAPEAVKLEAFAVMTALTAVFVHDEARMGDPDQVLTQLQASVGGGDTPRLAAALADVAARREADPFPRIMRGIFVGMLGA